MDMNMGMDMASSGGSINWLLVGIVAGAVVLGIIVGILLGRHTMKKKDI